MHTPGITQQRTRLKIIGAGFGRTGTLSLKTALETLGLGPCYHMIEAFNHPGDFATWQAATRGEPVDWRELFSGYQSAVDWPVCSFYAELMRIYPDAKIVLSVRDPENWYESVCQTIYRAGKGPDSPIGSLLFALIKTFVPAIRGVKGLSDALIWQQTFHGRFEDKDYAIAVFNQHIEQVKQRVPPNRLLVYNVKEGWGPLCAFLGIEEPKDLPFPRLNERKDFLGNSVMRRSGARVIGAGIALAGALLATFLLLRRRSK